MKVSKILVIYSYLVWIAVEGLGRATVELVCESEMLSMQRLLLQTKWGMSPSRFGFTAVIAILKHI